MKRLIDAFPHVLNLRDSHARTLVHHHAATGSHELLKILLSAPGKKHCLSLASELPVELALQVQEPIKQKGRSIKR